MYLMDRNQRSFVQKSVGALNTVAQIQWNVGVLYLKSDLGCLVMYCLFVFFHVYYYVLFFVFLKKMHLCVCLRTHS